ncbi:MAG: HAD-IIA family hydrolase [Lachnospiraceae bacterium]|jgi:HAD superfamily hydrolase (TIGR01450 family)
MNLAEKKLFLFDIDGTIANGTHLIDGTTDFLQKIHEAGGEYIFITNNSTKSIRDYVRKFDAWRIPTSEKNFITASYMTVKLLQQKYAGRLIYLMGTVSLEQELRKSGIRVTTDSADPEISCVLVGYDSELTYAKLVECCRVLSTRKTDFLATNPDLVCPIEFGFVPDCGSICQMLENAVKRRPYFIGKPDPGMVYEAMRQTGFTKQQTLVVGDRMYTDILCGVNAGADTALVLTGEADSAEEKASPYHASIVCPDIRELYEEWLAARQRGLSGQAEF